MKKIKRTFKTKQDAMKYEFKLWSKYSRIELVYAPNRIESGEYIWYVNY